MFHLWINFVCLYKNKTSEKIKPGDNLLSLMSMQNNIGCTDFYCMDTHTNLILYSTEEKKAYRVGMTWGRLNDDRIFIFHCNFKSHMFSLLSRDLACSFSFLWVHWVNNESVSISFLWSLLCTTCHPLTKPLPSSFWEFSRVGKPTAWVNASISTMRVKQSGSNNLPTSYLVLTHCPLTQNTRPHRFCFQRVWIQAFAVGRLQGLWVFMWRVYWVHDSWLMLFQPW